jgi:hypothetical protein
MKIGDKVRFLNAVGGGTVKRFQNKDIVLVEEEDGFETPVLIRECVVIGETAQTDKNTYASQVLKKEAPAETPTVKEEKYEITETPGGERLNVYLAFLPMDIKSIGKCNYETFLINESNYYLFFNYMNRQNNAWFSCYTSVIEPNTKLFIEEFSKEQINEREKVCIQLIAFKKDKPYSLKNAYSVELRIDGIKFYKLHSFRENDFFEDEALIYPVIRDDVPEREMLISASDLKEAMTTKAQADFPVRRPSPTQKENHLQWVEVDLHINQLLDSTSGLTNTDMLNVQLDAFRKTLEKYKNKKGQKIVFIHGKGEGVLKSALLNELKLKYKHFPVQDASFREYGFGATMITIK